MILWIHPPQLYKLIPTLLIEKHLQQTSSTLPESRQTNGASKCKRISVVYRSGKNSRGKQLKNSERLQ